MLSTWCAGTCTIDHTYMTAAQLAAIVAPLTPRERFDRTSCLRHTQTTTTTNISKTNVQKSMKQNTHTHIRLKNAFWYRSRRIPLTNPSILDRSSETQHASSSCCEKNVELATRRTPCLNISPGTVAENHYHRCHRAI